MHSKAEMSLSKSEYQDRGDEELFAMVQENDQQAFSVLYERYNRRLYSYCLRMLGSHAAAEDIFHDVFVKVYDNRQSFRGGSFVKWLFTIGRTTCLNAIRDRKHADDVNDLKDLLVGSDSSKTGENLFVREALRKAIAGLPPEFREVLILKQFNEYSYDEISDITGISISLAKVRVFRAIKMLQKTLAPYLRDVKK